MSVRVDISAIVIVKNEELNLPGLIENLRAWVGEIILVDDDSDDRTREIANAAGGLVRVIYHPMSKLEGFAGQRNVGTEAAISEWLLHMDCDERVTPEFVRELRQVTGQNALNGIRYRRTNFFLHRPMLRGGWETWNRPQIARRGFHHFEGAVHERCVIVGGEAATGQLASPMLHLNDESFEKRLKKSSQYVRIEAENWVGGRVTGMGIARKTVFEFLKKYLLKRGFIDGVPGLIAALHAATSMFRIQALVWDRQNPILRGDLEDEIASLWQKDNTAIEPRKDPD